MNAIFYILILLFIKFTFINAAGEEEGTSGSGQQPNRRKRPLKQTAQSGGDSKYTADIWKTGIFTNNMILKKEKTATCNLCSKELSTFYGNANIKRHARVDHPEIYEQHFGQHDHTAQKLSERSQSHVPSRITLEQEVAPIIFESSNHPQQHDQLPSQQYDPNIVQTLTHEIATAFRGQMVQSTAPQSHQQTVQQLPISRTQEMLQQLHVSSNQPQHQQQQGQTLTSGPTLRLSQQSINQIQQQRESRLSQQSLAQQMPHSMSQQMQPSTMSAQPSRTINTLNNIATRLSRQRTMAQGSDSNIQQFSSQLDKGKGIMTEEQPRTQSRPSERTFMRDAIRAERTSQLRHQSISQIQQSATQAGQLGSGTTMPRPSTFRATESFGAGGSGHTQLQSLSTASQMGHQSLSQQYQQQMVTQAGQTAAPLRSGTTMPRPSTLTQGRGTHPLQSLSGGTHQYGQPPSFGTAQTPTGTFDGNIPENHGITRRETEHDMLTGIIGRQSEATGTQPPIGLTTNRATGGRLSSLATSYGRTTQHQSSTNIDHQHENTGRDGELAMLTGMFSGQSSSAAGTQPPIGLTTNRATGGRLSSLATSYGRTTQHLSSGHQYGQETHGGAGGGTIRPSSFTGLAPLPPSLSMASRTQTQSNHTMQQEPSISNTQPNYSQTNFAPDHYLEH